MCAICAAVSSITVSDFIPLLVFETLRDLAIPDFFPSLLPQETAWVVSGHGERVIWFLALLWIRDSWDYRLFGLGAGLGGPLGGWVHDTFGWWVDATPSISFWLTPLQEDCLFHAGNTISAPYIGIKQLTWLQAPIFVFSFILVIAKVNIRLPSEIQNQSLSEKLQRVDVLGSVTLVAAVGLLLLGFSLKTTEELAWSHPLIISLFGFSITFGLGFVYVEKHWAPYPVMPLRLMAQRTPLAVSLSNLLTSMTAFSMVSANDILYSNI